MKSRLIPLAAALACAAAIPAHAEGPINGKVYGKLRLSIDHINQDQSGGKNQSLNKLESHASRIGFAGKTELEGQDGLAVIYQAEYGVDGQIGSGAGNWTTRNTFLGLDGSFGQIIAGVHDTPMKSSQDGVDQFNDLDGDLGAIFNGEDRLSQMVMYSTPSMGAVHGSVALVMSKDNAADINKATNTDKNGVSASLSYDSGMLYGAVAYNSNIRNANTTRVTGVIKPMSDLQVGALWQQTKYDDTSLASGVVSGTNAGDSQSGYLLSAGYSVGGGTTLKAEYGNSDIYKLGLAGYNKDASIGADHKIGKNTKIEGWYTQLKQDNGDKTGYLAIGMEHKF